MDSVESEIGPQARSGEPRRERPVEEATSLLLEAEDVAGDDAKKPATPFTPSETLAGGEGVLEAKGRGENLESSRSSCQPGEASARIHPCGLLRLAAGPGPAGSAWQTDRLAPHRLSWGTGGRRSPGLSRGKNHRVDDHFRAPRDTPAARTR
jgi:hypothetical protein